MDSITQVEIADGIRLQSVNTSINYGRTGTYLYVNVAIEIGEEYSIARKDASVLEELIVDTIHDIVEDYAEDGQEVE